MENLGDAAVLLKDGRNVSIRVYQLSDKEGLVAMYAGLTPESLRWSMPPYNRQRIERWISNLDNSIMLVALDNGKIVGHLQISMGTSPPFRHAGDLMIYLHQDYQNAGLGAGLIREGLRIARERGLHRVELTVVADNHRGLRLYEKMGFSARGYETGELSRV